MSGFRSSIFVSVLVALVAVAAPSAWTADIHGAARLGDLDGVKAILAEDPASAGSIDENGATPLHAAVASGHRDVALLLIKADRKLLAAREGLGLSPLNLAALQGQVEIVEMLLDQGADIETGDRENSRPLHNAAARGHLEVIRLLIRKGADVKFQDANGATPLHFAATVGNMEVIRLLVASGAGVNQRNSTQGMAPLHWAVSRDKLDAVDLLVSKGADMEIRDDEGRTPLFLAVINEKIRAARLLLEKGANVDAAAREGDTPLLVALHGSRRMANLLIENGADIEVENDHGWNALHNATFGGFEDVVALLIEKGLDVNAATNNGITPLFGAGMRGRPDLVKLLVQKGAEVNVANGDGVALLQRMIVDGRKEIIKILLAAGARTDTKGLRYGRTGLHWAAIKGSTDLAELLLSHGAAPDQKDSAGKTPLFYAGKYGSKDVADLLLSRGAAPCAMEKNYGKSPWLERRLDEKEAVLWYLGHCGWAIKTKSHFLIFDYWESGAEPDRPSLANGHIDTAEIEGENVHVFVTHEHGDHFDPTVFWWRRELENVTYILGWEKSKAPEHFFTPPRTTTKIDGMTVTTIEANDAGVGFLVEVDGLTIYHAGDHAGWAEGEKEGYTREIDYLAGKVSHVDLAFLNITGCHAHDPEALAEGTVYTLKKLSPLVMIPTHAGGREYLYSEYAERAVKENWKVKVVSVENRGDSFQFRKGTIN